MVFMGNHGFFLKSRLVGGRRIRQWIMLYWSKTKRKGYYDLYTMTGYDISEYEIFVLI